MMKSAAEVINGKIVDVSENGVLTIQARYDDMGTLIKRGYHDCYVQLIDARPISDKQRRSCYALLREIAEYTGNSVEMTKEHMKLKFLAEDLQSMADYFSLSNAPMSVICAFQRYLVRFMVEWDIPCAVSLLDYVDDVDDYIYACLAAKKCCICGRFADLHHVDHVGMGRDRDDIIHEGMRVLPLCRMHHTEAHEIGKEVFRANTT